MPTEVCLTVNTTSPPGWTWKRQCWGSRRSCHWSLKFLYGYHVVLRDKDPSTWVDITDHDKHLIFSSCIIASSRYTSRGSKTVSLPYKLHVCKFWMLGVNISSLGSSLKHPSHFCTTVKCQERWSIKHYPPISDPVIRGYRSTGHPLIFDQLNCKPAGIQNVCNCQTWDLGRACCSGEHSDHRFTSFPLK